MSQFKNTIDNVKGLNFGNMILQDGNFVGRVAVNDDSDTGVNRGLSFWNGANNQWGIYLASASNTATPSNSWTGAVPCTGCNFSANAMRFRSNRFSTQGFIFENAGDSNLLSIRGSDGMTFMRGFLGMGRSNPTFQVDLSTDSARKLTTTTWSTGSDERVKDNIEDADIDVCYSNVKGLKLKRFEWSSNIYPEVSDRHSIGFIAQEVKGVFPKAVSYTNDYGHEDFHNLDTDQIIKCLYGAVQKLIEKVEQLEAQNNLS